MNIGSARAAFILYVTLQWQFIGCCAFKKGGCPSDSIVGKIANCAKQTVHDHAPGLLPIISDIFASGRDEDAKLGDLARAIGSDGLDIVVCVVEQFLNATERKINNLSADRTGQTEKLKDQSYKAQRYLSGWSRTK